MRTEVLEKESILSDVCRALFSIDPLQKKAVLQHLQSLDTAALKQIEGLLNQVTEFLKSNYTLSLLDCAQAYSKMCREMLFEQIKFSKTGQYSSNCLEDVQAVVYDSEENMSKYMYGLALSIFLWPNHFAIYNFFIDELLKINDVNNYLEIGPGHGLFILQAMKRWRSAHFTAVDISPTSAKISSAFINHSLPGRKVDFRIQDFNDFNEGTYDFITMGEVLEHIEDPMGALENLRSLLSPTGYCFLSTCANCPVVDHIYLFHDTDDMRDHIKKAGLDIVCDLALPVESVASTGKYSHKIGINYAAIVKKAPRRAC